MRTLYHLWLSPFSRKTRVALAEKNLEFTMQIERVWERRRTFLAMNPAGQVPVLVEEDGTAIADSDAICEYLDEAYPEPPLIGETPMARAEVRRQIFRTDVGEWLCSPLVGGKVPRPALLVPASAETRSDSWAGDRFLIVQRRGSHKRQ